MSLVPVEVQTILRRHSTRVWCPVCGAPIREDCANLFGRRKRVPHVRRGRLAARVYPDPEKP